MQRLVLSAALLLSACGPGMPHHTNTPDQAQKSDDDGMICNEADTDPRASTRPHCRRKADVENDKRAAQDAINYGTTSQRTR